MALEIHEVVNTASSWYGESEFVVDSFEDAVELFEQLARSVSVSAPWKLVWRGQDDAAWGLHSSLYRTLEGHRDGLPAEVDLAREEARRFDCSRDEWMLDRHVAGRLSALELLAALQHLDSPTRLVDFTHNGLVALWFAVAAGGRGDARMFAVDVSNTTRGRERVSRRVPTEWPRASDMPWRDGWNLYNDETWYWTPHPIEARMSRQQGCFLVGNVPDRQDQRKRTSLPLSPVDAATLRRIGAETPGSGRYPGNFLVLVRITGGSKARIRRMLERTCGYTPAMMYPDLPGFARYAFPRN